MEQKLPSDSWPQSRAKDIADFIKEREDEGVSGNTIRLDLAVISRLFNVARASWGMENLRTPVELAIKPKIAKGRERRLEEGEEGRILEHCTDLFRPVFLFAIETAMRREEIADLKWDRINLRSRTAFLPETKNGTARTVPLSPVALSILESLPEPHSGSVFQMTKEMVTRHMMRATAAAGIKNLTFPDLRHEGTSRLFELTDLDIMEIKSITGHTEKAIERSKSSVRSKVEHPFLIVKRYFGFAKTVYRGLAQNTHRLYSLFASANLLMCARAGRSLRPA